MLDSRSVHNKFDTNNNLEPLFVPQSTEPTSNTMVTTTAKPITNQSDGAPVNQINDKKDTTNTTSTLNNSSHSKIPVLNPSARSMKCASWAGNDLPITPDMNDLTPGKSKSQHRFY